jgi:hypothetical protein
MCARLSPSSSSRRRASPRVTPRTAPPSGTAFPTACPATNRPGDSSPAEARSGGPFVVWPRGHPRQGTRAEENLVELAAAFVLGLAFAAVVQPAMRRFAFRPGEDREDGRCPARTGDLLLVRREQLLLSTAACRSVRSSNDESRLAAAVRCGLSLPQRFHMIAPACTRKRDFSGLCAEGRRQGRFHRRATL